MENQVLETIDTLPTVTELDDEALSSVGGGYPCSYLGVEDWKLMMSYETRNYCC